MTLAYKPDWFNLDDYLKHTETLTEREWGIVLNIRIYLWNYMNGVYGDTSIDREYANEWLNTIIPFYRPKARPSETLSVSSVSLDRLAIHWGFYSELPKAMKNNLAERLLKDGWHPKKYTAKELEICETPLELLDDIRGSDFNDLGVGIIASINLNASEEQLMADFKKWITHSKRQLQLQPIKRNYTAKDFQGWHEKRLLPYIDLIIDAKYQNKPLTNYQAGCLIFPDEMNKDISETVRKTIRPQALELLTEEALHILRSQSAV